MSKIRPRQKDSARSGDRLHKIQEGYLRHGLPPPPESDPFGALARQGLPHMPHPGTVHVEQRFTIAIDGIVFHGVIDMLGPSQAFPDLRTEYRKKDEPPADPVPPGVWCVGDHKTSKNPGRYGIWARADRVDDPQTLIYDTAIGGDVANRWLYYQKTQDVLIWELQQYQADGGADPVVIEKMKRGIVNAPRTAKGKPSDCLLTRHEIRGGIERVVLPVAEKIVRMREQRPNPLDVEANTDHCHEFGGCEYLGTYCNPTANETAATIFGKDGSMAGLWDKLNVNGAPGAPVDAPAAPAATAPQFSFAFAQPTATPTPAAPTPAPTQTAPAPAFVQAPAPMPAQTVTVAPPAGITAAEAAIMVQQMLSCVGRALIAAGRALGGE